MSEDGLFTDLDGLASRIADGAKLGMPADASGVSMAAVHALVRRRVQRLALINLPTGGIATDLLIGAGCVDEIETSGVSLGEFGPARRFADAVRSGAIRIKDATCPAIHAGLLAAEFGSPFMPLRGILGSDLLGRREDWTVIDNPFGEADPIVLLKAIQPDLALFHAALADHDGNVWIGRRLELKLLAHASRGSLATVEALHDGDLLADDRFAAGTIPATYLEAVALAPGAAAPCAFWYGDQPVDAAHMRRYADLSRTAEGFARYLEEEVLKPRRAA
jgi:glutaconate CoA-transferase, subunit A